jgi:hypothetical protein
MDEDTRYARSDGIERFITRADVELDEAIRDKMGRIQRLDDVARTVAAAPASTVFETVLLIAAATTAWDEARRLSGMPELCIANQRPASKFPFGGLGAALAFHHQGRHTLIGAGSLQVPSVQDRKEDLDLRRFYNACGIETIPCKGTPPSMDAEPRGVKVLDLWISVDAAIRRAEPWRAHKAALSWLVDAHVGRLERVAKAQRQGANKGAPHKHSPQWEHVRQRVEDVMVNGTRVEGIATRAGEPPQVVRNALKIARGRVLHELVRAELIPKHEPRKRERTRTVEPVPVFASW